MNFLAKLFGMKFDRAAALQAELDRMQTVLADARRESEQIISDGSPEKSAGRLAEIAALETALERRLTAGKIPLLRLRVADLIIKRDEALENFREKHRLQHSEADRLKIAFTELFESKRDGAAAVKMQPLTLKRARAERFDAHAALGEVERDLKNSREELDAAERAHALAVRRGLAQPEPTPRPVDAARRAAGMAPLAAAVAEASPLPKANC